MNRNAICLIVSSLTILTIGGGMTPLMPVFISEIGNSASTAGFYLGFCIIFLCVGHYFAGWLSGKFLTDKWILVTSGMIAIPLLSFLGLTKDIWMLTLLNALRWFFVGIGLSAINILAAKLFSRKKHGKIFGFLAATSPFGLIIGASIGGRIADEYGFSAMFLIFSVCILPVWPITGYLLIEGMEMGKNPNKTIPFANKEWKRSFFLLLSATLTASIASFSGLFGTTLIMKNESFSLTDIGNTVAIAGLGTAILAPVIGWLSDKCGWSHFIYFANLIGVAGIFMLTISGEWWYFCILVLFIRILSVVNKTSGKAIMAGLGPKEFQSQNMAIWGTIWWLGAGLGYAVTGCSFEYWGVVPTFTVIAFLPLLSIICIVLIGKEKPLGTSVNPAIER